MSRNLILIGVIILMSGCVQSISIADKVEGPFNTIVAKSIVVNDLTRAPNTSRQDGVWSSEFHPLDDDILQPSFRQLTINRTKSSFKADGQGSNILVISLVDVVILQKARVADSIAIVGIVSALSPRDFRCLVDVNFQYGTYTSRRTFDYSAELPRSWVDAKTVDRQSFVRRCLSSITEKMAAYIKILPGQN